eukprot:415092-Rhodomonas_salina.1
MSERHGNRRCAGSREPETYHAHQAHRLQSAAMSCQYRETIPASASIESLIMGSANLSDQSTVVFAIGASDGTIRGQEEDRRLGTTASDVPHNDLIPQARQVRSSEPIRRKSQHTSPALSMQLWFDSIVS